MSELDLEHGDEAAAEEITKSQALQRNIAAAKGRSSKSTRGKTSSSTAGRPTAAEKREGELKARILGTFDRIARALEERDDEELAIVFREDGSAMAQGLVSLTHNFVPLRKPLLFLLNGVEPLLAFGRLGRVLFGRARNWRLRKLEERAEWEASQTPHSAGDEFTTNQYVQ